MPLRVAIDHDKRFVHVEGEGDVVLAEVLDYFNSLVTQNAMPYPKLVDATRATPRFSDDDVMQMGAWMSAYAVMEPRGPVAIVSVEEATTAMMARYINVGAGRRPIALFKTIDEARRWLEAQAGPKKPASDSSA